VRPQQVMELLDLILLGDVGELLQEALKVTAQRGGEKGEKLLKICLYQINEVFLF